MCHANLYRGPKTSADFQRPLRLCTEAQAPRLHLCSEMPSLGQKLLVSPKLTVRGSWEPYLLNNQD